MTPSDELEEFELGDSIDNAILMHRDAHFGGSFAVMIEYYEKEGKGVNPEFELRRIRELDKMEKEMGANLAALRLSGPEAERVQQSLQAYKSLRDLADNTSATSHYPRLIADLIFSEEEDATPEVDAIVAEKTAIVPHLINLLRSDDFRDPLFPGYGLAPALATRCLGRIGDKRALISLFEEIGKSDVLEEEDTLLALKAIGEPAKQFLLKVLQGRPLDFDNERAATALIQFKDDPEVTAACLKMLEDPQVWRDLPLSTYLILACEDLQDPASRQQLMNIAKQPNFPSMLMQDIKIIVRNWSTGTHETDMS